MGHPPLSSFEQDIATQPDALESFAATPFPAGFRALEFETFDRIILTGMGSSDYAAIPLELVLARRGLPVWRLQAGRLLETPEMITTRSLLLITSQSGRSGEIVALLDQIREIRRGIVAAITNDSASPLGQAAGGRVLHIQSGAEATVSSKSYLNTLAAIHRLCAHLEGSSDVTAVSEVRAVATSLRTALAAPSPEIDRLAEQSLAQPDARLALVGVGSDAATALTGALILKEAAKVAAEGYVGGAFRHGPIELAGPSLTVLLLGAGGAADVTFTRLARDLEAAGSLTVAVSPTSYAGAEHLAVPSASTLERLSHSMFAVQRLGVRLARLAGRIPGEFRHGQKITAQL